MLLTRANRFMALQRLCVQMLWANVDKTFVGCTRSDGACTLRTQHMDIAIAILTLPYSRARHPWTCITHSLGSQGALVCRAPRGGAVWQSEFRSSTLATPRAETICNRRRFGSASRVKITERGNTTYALFVILLSRALLRLF